MILQQSTALIPLPGVFIPFAAIAGRARQHQVTHIVSRNIGTCYTADWKRMLDFIVILPLPVFLDTLELGKPALGIVTTVVLPLQLLGYLCSRMCSLNLLFTRSTFVFMCKIHLAKMLSICLTPTLTLSTVLGTVSSIVYDANALIAKLWMLLSISARAYSMHLTFMFNIALLAYSRWSGMPQLMPLSLSSNLILMAAGIFLIICYITLFTPRAVSINRCDVLAEIRKSFNLIAPHTQSLIRWDGWFAHCWMRGITAGLTIVFKAIWSAFVSIEEFSGSRMPLLAFRTRVATFERNIILGYTIGHDRNSHFLSSPGVLTASQDTPFLPHHYTINPPVEQAHDKCCCAVEPAPAPAGNEAMHRTQEEA